MEKARAGIYQDGTVAWRINSALTPAPIKGGTTGEDYSRLLPIRRIASTGSARASNSASIFSSQGFDNRHLCYPQLVEGGGAMPVRSASVTGTTWVAKALVSRSC